MVTAVTDEIHHQEINTTTNLVNHLVCHLRPVARHLPKAQNYGITTPIKHTKVTTRATGTTTATIGAHIGADPATHTGAIIITKKWI